jgi:hypothetical protein
LQSIFFTTPPFLTLAKYFRLWYFDNMTNDNFYRPSSFSEMEVRATVALDNGDGGTRRACNNENCSKEYRHEGKCDDGRQ